MSALALSLTAALAVAAAGPDQEPAPAKPDGFTPLFNGRDLTGWTTFLQKHGKNADPDRVITIEDGAIHLYKHAADGDTVVMGYIATEKEYGDYHFRVQFRWGTKKFQPRYALKRDAGIYYHILGPDAVWPRRAPVPGRADQRRRPDRPARSPARLVGRPRDPLRDDAHVPRQGPGG